MKAMLSISIMTALLLSAPLVSAEDGVAPYSAECNCPPQGSMLPLGSAPTEKPLAPQQEGVVVIETPSGENPFLVAPLLMLLGKTFPIPDGEMNILLSPQEKISLKQGKVIDYYCVEEGDSRCRLKMPYVHVVKDMSGGVRGVDGKPVQLYRNIVYGLTDEAKADPPDAIFEIDGIPVKVETKEGGMAFGLNS